MRRVFFWFCVFFSFGGGGLFCAGFDEDAYNSLSDYFDSLYKIDPNAGASAFPVLTVPLGGRQEALAGAFSAVADDVSFIEWNPAGSSGLEQTELAFFHNNWIADAKIEGAAFATRLGNLGLGASGKLLWLPFTEYDDFGEHLSKGYYSEGVITLNVSYCFFRSYDFDGVSAGLNLKTAFRSVPDFAGSAGSVAAGSGSGQSAATLIGDVGFLTRVNLAKFYHANEKNAAFALVLRNYGKDVMGDPLPTALVAAFAYKPLRPLSLSFDFVLPLRITSFFDLDYSLSEKPYWSLGFGARVTQFLTARAGFMIKPGAIRATLGSEITTGTMTFYLNYTLDLLTQFRPLNRLTVGLRFDLGDGGRREKRIRVEELYFEGIGAYTEGRDDDARKAWEDALFLDKKFEPAREAILMLDNFEALEQRIINRQQL